MLVKRDIQKAIESGDIVIDVYRPEQLNPNSYNLRLGNILQQYDADHEILDPRRINQPRDVELKRTGRWLLKPGVLYLGATDEFTSTSEYIPMINGRSSLARLGVTVHQTGGFGDIGFRGYWTLELVVVRPVYLYPGMEIAQICWFRPSSLPEVSELYNGKYKNQPGHPIPSRLHEECE